jgi:hypothetical protein
MSTFTLEDKNVLLRAEIARLKRQLGKAHEALRYWKDQALYFKAERDRYREQSQERKHDL